MLLADDWKDYELIDTGGGEKLERWGEYLLRRPDPQVIWPVRDESGIWNKVHARYHRSSSGGGRWEYLKKIPERWIIGYSSLSFYVRLTGFKHTGLFPEQAVNWKWIIEKAKSAGGPLRVLNLFAYTGSSTAAAASAGAEVCHVDAAKGMVERAKENIKLSGLPDGALRFITDDVIKFVEREGRRGKKYDAVIMDPPSYGRGPKGETWKLEDELYGLVGLCLDILSEKPCFFLVNSYTAGLSPTVIKNILDLLVRGRFGGSVSSDEIGLPVKATGLVLPCGSTGRWEI